MALDRQTIQKTDFPLGAHGYDPQAVDSHLSAIADEIDEFKSASRRRSESIAAAAADQVRQIIEAAERSASDIQREAETEAREIREEAQHEAQATREAASGDVRQHVSKLAEATASMQSRLDGMESELSSLLDSLRSGSSRIDSDLRQLEAELSEVRQNAVPAGAVSFQPDQPPAPEASDSVPTYDPDWGSTEDESVSSGASAEPGQEGSSDPYGAPEPEPYTAETVAEQIAPYSAGPIDEPLAPSPHAAGGGEGGSDSGLGEPGPSGASQSVPFGGWGDEAGTPSVSQGEGADDAEGARLIALNMALNGTPREETARYLADNFRLSDRDGLLDEVYASVEG